MDSPLNDLYWNHDLKMKIYEDLKFKNETLMSQQNTRKMEMEKQQQQYDNDNLLIEENNKTIELMESEFKNKLKDLQLKYSGALERQRIILEREEALKKEELVEMETLVANRDKYFLFESSTLHKPNIYSVDECVKRTLKETKTIANTLEKRQADLSIAKKQCAADREKSLAILSEVTNNMNQEAKEHQPDNIKLRIEYLTGEINKMNVMLQQQVIILDELKDKKNCDETFYISEQKMFMMEIKNVKNLKKKTTQIYQDKLAELNTLMKKSSQ